MATSKIQPVIVKVEYEVSSPATIAVNGVQYYDITSLIPSRMEPIALTNLQGLSSASLYIAELYYQNSHWYIRIFNMYTSSISVQPKFHVYCKAA